MILKGKVGPLNEQQKTFLETSHKNLLKLSKNIDDLLGPRRAGDQKEDVCRWIGDLSKVLDISSDHRPLAKSIRIHIDAPFLLSRVIIQGVEDKLIISFDNLLTNAIKYNRGRRKGHVTLIGIRFSYIQLPYGHCISQNALKDVLNGISEKKPTP